jgi:FGGY family of carbohydrate kinases, C-terminal domain
MKRYSKSELAHLKAYGGMKNGDVATEVLADGGGFEVVLPEMWESSALGSALLSGIAIGLFGRGQRRLDVSIRRGRIVCTLWLCLRSCCSTNHSVDGKRAEEAPEIAEVYFAFGEALLENAIARL